MEMHWLSEIPFVNNNNNKSDNYNIQDKCPLLQNKIKNRMDINGADDEKKYGHP